MEFRKGYIEKLGEAGLKDNTFDVIVLVFTIHLINKCFHQCQFRSNCVVNLSPDKKAVLQEAHRVLKVSTHAANQKFSTVL